MEEHPVIYLKAEQSSYLNCPDIRIRDVSSVYCRDEETAEKIRNIEIYKFEKDKEGRAFLSILYLIQEIEKVISRGEIRNVGEQDLIIYYRPEQAKTNPWLLRAKICFICLSCFLGTGISIMGYNNDVDMAKVFSQLYETFLGIKPDGPTFIELFYSLGLTVGIFLFFNHTPGKKITNEPTPIQVQMRLYEQDVNQTFILGASRKDAELDVDH